MAEVKNLDRLLRKIAKLPKAVSEAARAANDKCADEFMSDIRRVVPRGEPDPGRLERTLTKGPGRKPLAVEVSIGGPDAPYPAHLEFGHLAPGGKHVPAERFWFPTLRVGRKRYRSIRNKAANKAIKAVANGGS